MFKPISLKYCIFILNKGKITLLKKTNGKQVSHVGTPVHVEKNWLPFALWSHNNKMKSFSYLKETVVFFNISVVEFMWVIPRCEPKMTELDMGGDTRINTTPLILFLSISGAIMLSTSPQKCCVNMSLQQKCSWCADNTCHVFDTPACYLSWPNTEDKQCHGSAHVL